MESGVNIRIKSNQAADSNRIWKLRRSLTWSIGYGLREVMREFSGKGRKHLDCTALSRSYLKWGHPSTSMEWHITDCA